jgi:ribokinase
MGRVFVAGSINMDVVATAERHPQVGETVAGKEVLYFPGGKGANQAVAAARAGAAVRVIGAVGEQDGEESVAALAAEGVDVSAVARVSAPTGHAVVLVEDGSGDNQIAVASGANALLSAAHVTASLAALQLVPADVVVLSFELPEPVLQATVLVAAASGARLLVNPAPAEPGYVSLLGGAIATPNAGELAALTGLGLADAELTDDERGDAQLAASELASVSAGAVSLAERTGAPVLATLGANGAVLALADVDADADGPEYFPSFRVDVRDTTGAGDTLTGVLAAGLAGGSDLCDSISRAMAAAALAVTRDGARTAMPTAAEIDEFLRAVSGPTQGS